MTDFDKKLIEKAGTINRWNWRDIDILISIADTPEARAHLEDIRGELRNLVQETL